MDEGAVDAAREVARRLAERGETLAVAESSAGGRIAGALLDVPGASRWFLGAVVVYSEAAKRIWLGIDPAALAQGGAVSEAAARELAAGARRALGATWGVAETGIAGPQVGRRSSKPAGLAYVAVDGPATLAVEVLTGLDARRANQEAFARAALRALLHALESAAR